MTDHSAPPSTDELIDRLLSRLRESARVVVPRFLAQMPRMYFQDTDPETQLAHLSAVVAAQGTGLPPSAVFRSEDDQELTFLLGRDYPGLLSELLKQLRSDRVLRSAKVHSAADNHLVLDVFRFGDAPRFDPSDAGLAEKRALVLEYAASQNVGVDLERLATHFESCTAEYLQAVTPLRIFEHFKLINPLVGTDDTLVLRSPFCEPGEVRINIATGNATPQAVFRRIVDHLGHRKIDIRRAYLDRFDLDERGSISVIGMVLSDDERMASVGPGHLCEELGRLRWLDDTVLSLAYGHAELDLRRAEIALALAHLAHARLAPQDPFAFSHERLLRLLGRYAPLTREVALLFDQRFDPTSPLTGESFEARVSELRALIDDRLGESTAREAFDHMLTTVAGSLKTNLYVPGRYALSIRLRPDVITPPQRALPYGVFFVFGRAADGFHVRFRDVARGGVRVVRPRGPEQHALESQRHFEEVYELAFAQQLKNKDIPEGGSKAVVLLGPDAPIDRAVHAFTDALLDLLTDDPETRSRVVDHGAGSELLYLGPDENITPEHIEWVVDRAARRGYAVPNAFMSSKPGAGINHKEYGVTSEGVTVFLDEALRHIGIDPRQQTFTVTMTGGPDGDVAGNEMKILHREYGSHARIIGIADGSGCAEDPEGLAMEALLELVDRSAPIAEFPRDRLGPKGRVVGLSDEHGAQLRNSLHHRLSADAFIPAGGRPATINDHNWRSFINDGQPASKLIVEGANLFVTPNARAELAKHGVVIVKDSSANKCGVICSSYEILASMLVTPETFMEIKPTFVREVLDKLRDLARREAQLLFRELKQRRDVTLPDLSVEVSRVVGRAADAISHSLEQPNGPSAFDDIVRAHLPASLVGCPGIDIAKLPRAYYVGIVAASLATRIVYREGLAFMASLDQDSLAELARQYLDRERESEALANEVLASGLANKERIADLLRRGGPRAALSLA